MDINQVINQIKEYCNIATVETIELIMKNIDNLLNSIPENIYNEVAEKIEKYMKTLNQLYIKRMMDTGKVFPLYIENFINPSSN